MTLPDERYRALVNVRAGLFDLAYEPGPVRKRDLRFLVHRLLRHYPTQHEIDSLAAACPTLLRRTP